MAGERQTYSRRQVELAERRAWAESGGRRFYYDGINFWLETATGRCLTPRKGTPEDGWRHADDCRCILCRLGGSGTAQLNASRSAAP